MQAELIHKATSALPQVRSFTFGVLKVAVAGEEHFVVVDQQTMQSVDTFDDRDRAVASANAHTMAEDLAFLADRFPKDFRGGPGVGEVLHCGYSLRRSSDGLDLLPAILKTDAVGAALDQEFGKHVEMSQAWRRWRNFMLDSPTVLATQPQSVVVMLPLGRVDPEDEEREVESELPVLVNFEWGVGGPSRVEIGVIDTQKEIGGKWFGSLLHGRDGGGGARTLFAANREDLDGEDLRHFPLFKAYGKPDQIEGGVMVFEGGEVMTALAKRRPWLMLRDSDGQAVPCLVISGPNEEYSEERLELYGRQWSSLTVADDVTRSRRADVVREQQRSWSEPPPVKEQVFHQDHGGGRFRTAAHLVGNATFEWMFVEERANVIGTREWFGYRLWVEDELVLDAMPGSFMGARLASLAPSENRLATGAQPTSAQVGQLLNLALTEVLDDEDARNVGGRVQAFLESSFADELRVEADALERGEAILQNGVPVRLSERHQEMLFTP